MVTCTQTKKKVPSFLCWLALSTSVRFFRSVNGHFGLQRRSTFFFCSVPCQTGTVRLEYIKPAWLEGAAGEKQKKANIRHGRPPPVPLFQRVFIVIDDDRPLRGERHCTKRRRMCFDDTPFGAGERPCLTQERVNGLLRRCVLSSRCTERKRRRSFWRTTSDQTPSSTRRRTYTHESQESVVCISRRKFAAKPCGKIKRGRVSEGRTKVRRTPGQTTLNLTHTDRHALDEGAIITVDEWISTSRKRECNLTKHSDTLERLTNSSKKIPGYCNPKTDNNLSHSPPFKLDESAIYTTNCISGHHSRAKPSSVVITTRSGSHKRSDDSSAGRPSVSLYFHTRALIAPRAERGTENKVS